MNLITSFNGKFLKENIKKSKGAVIFSVIIIPILTALMLFTNYKSSSNVEIMTNSEYLIFNIAFLFIIPFVFSKIFFGFIYNKKSVDFINSMPLNRKTIFITNTIGGILLITLIQILTILVFLMFSALFGSIAILPQMLIDSFFMMWLTYVFIFIATNLAMTISGTFMTQIVVTALILFLIPFCRDCFFAISQDNLIYNEITLVNGEEEFTTRLMPNIKNYTMPYKIIRYLSSFNNIFSTETLLRMAILSVGYFIFGLHLFKKRKMENCEESFFSLESHLIVKAITLLPILLLANLLGKDVGSLTYDTIIVAMIAIYYFVYDFIVKRKVPFRISLLSFVSSMIILEVAILGVSNILSVINSDQLEINNVKSISFGSDKEEYIVNIANYSYKYKFLDNKFFFEDDELIDFVFEKAYKNSDSNYKNQYLSDNIYTKLQVNLKTNLGKVYSVRLSFNESEMNKIYDKIFENEKYSKTIIKNIVSSNGILLNNSKLLNTKEFKKVNKILKDNLDLKELVKLSDKYYFIEKYSYVNHKLQKYSIPIEISEDLVKEIAEIERKKLKKYLKENTVLNGYLNCKKDNKSYFIEDEKNAIKFIKENIDDEFDSSKPYCTISGTLRNRKNNYNVVFFTNKIEEIDEFIDEDDSYNYNYDYDYDGRIMESY